MVSKFSAFARPLDALSGGFRRFAELKVEHLVEHLQSFEVYNFCKWLIYNIARVAEWQTRQT